MAASPAPPHHPPTAGPLFPPTCSQCVVAILVLGGLTAIFMVVCLSLSFKLSRRSRRRDMVATPVPLELWAAPPTSHSQTNLLWPSEPATLPRPPPLNENRNGATLHQPRVTLQDIDQFWWRNFKDM